MAADASVSGVRVMRGVVVNGLSKVTVICSPEVSGNCGLGSGGVELVPVVIEIVPAVSLPSIV